MFGQFVSFGNLVPPFPIGMLRSQSSSFTSGCNRWRQPCCITSCTIGGSTRNELTPICSCGEMAALRMTRTPKNIGKKFWDVIIMTQMRQINDLEKSLKVAEKRLQLVIWFT
ncbi:hypothetical protein DEO72_LG9g250 [Vigna unguiculata]|uniref:Uncharacterized protein n=1 Tax=Vigna unguiculata TaxID=3917 RepID=A0A4D6MZL6_VIGUN|nr:hypothetical protein DEO72_LG9g250 [Vigna unguiculata]